MKTKFKILTAFLLTFAIILSVALIGAAEEPGETELDNSTYYDFASSVPKSGSFRCDNYTHTNVTLYDGSTFLRLQGKDVTMAKSDYYNLLLQQPYSHSTQEVDYIVVDFDIATESEILNKLTVYTYGFMPGASSAQTGESYSVKQDGENIKFIGTDVNFTIPGGANEWTHITMVIEISNKETPMETTTQLHFFANGEYKDSTTSSKKVLGATGTDKFVGVRFSQGSQGTEASSETTLLLDELSIRTYAKVSDTEGSLAYVLADKENRNLSEWTQGMWKSDYSFPPSNVAAIIGSTPYDSFAEAYEAWQDGDTITIYKPVTELFEVTKPITIDTRGNEFNYFSNTLILKSVNGNVISFGEGEITVNFYDANGVLLGSEVYTSAKKVTVPDEVTEQLPEYISYSVNENGSTAIMLTDGWKKVITAGAPSFNADELGYATPDNCNFYVNSYPVTAAIVSINKDGVLTEHADGDLAAVVKEITAGSKVMLNADITLTSPVVVNKDVTIDFNTYTIDYSSIHSMFVVKGGILDLEGPGKINKTTKASFVFEVAEGVDASIKLNGVDVVSNTVIANVLSGSLDISNSTIKVEGGDDVDAIVVKNADVAIDNSTIEIEASGDSSYVIKAEGANVTVVSSTLNSNKGGLMTDETSSATVEGDTTIKAETAFGGETENVILKEGVQISTSNGTENLPLPENTVFAYTEDGDIPYVLTSDYVVVTWKVGEFECVENWVRGAKPFYKDASVDEALVAYQANNTDKTKMYAFSISRVHEDTKFEPQLINIIAPMYNVEVGVNFNFNVYVPTEQFGAKTVSIILGENEIQISALNKVTIENNEYYAIEIADISPFLAAENITFKVGFAYDGDDASYELTFAASIVKYCDAILTTGLDEYNEDTLSAALALLNYVDKAYKYLGKTNTELAAILAKHEVNFEAINYGDEYESQTNTENKEGYFDDAYFVFDENGARYEFVIAEGFTGRIKIYQGGDVTVYNVTDGKVDGSSLIVYVPDVECFFDPISIQLNMYTANNSNKKILVYDVFDYVTNENNDAKTQAFVDSLVYWLMYIAELPVID